MALIYSPSGKAAEYSRYAFNGWTGCQATCSYCYNKKGRGAKLLGAEGASLRKCFKDIPDAIRQFNNSLKKNIVEYQKHGIFFSFVGDPLSAKTKELTFQLIEICRFNDIIPTVLTKQVDWIEDFEKYDKYWVIKDIDFGFTLTGMDELEQGCPSSGNRIMAMKILHQKGFKVWSSIEPVIDFSKAFAVFTLSYKYCDSYKIGLLSGKKFDKKEVIKFVENITAYNYIHANKEIIFKESIQKYL